MMNNMFLEPVEPSGRVGVEHLPALAEPAEGLRIIILNKTVFQTIPRTEAETGTARAIPVPFGFLETEQFIGFAVLKLFPGVLFYVAKF